MMSGAVIEARSRRLGLQHGNSGGRTVFLSKKQACRGVLPNEDLPDQKYNVPVISVEHFYYILLNSN